MNPNLFVVGAMKAGTTSLYLWLKNHPGIYMSPIKEPNYYCSDLWGLDTHIASATKAQIDLALSMGSQGLHNALIKDRTLYFSLFPSSSPSIKYFGEASPSYLRSHVAARYIAADCPDAKIIILLRDPIERAWSHFIMERNEARVPKSFGELIDSEISAMQGGVTCQHGILESGLYFKCISRYLDCFPEENVLIADCSVLRSERLLFVGKLNSFLGFKEDLFLLDIASGNASVAPRSALINSALALFGVKELVRKLAPQSVIDKFKSIYYKKALHVDEVEPHVRAMLMDFYSEDVMQLVSLLGDQAPIWTKKYSMIKQ